MVSVGHTVMMMHKSVTVYNILYDYYYNFNSRIIFIKPDIVNNDRVVIL